VTATTFAIGRNSFREVATDDGRVLDDAETPPRDLRLSRFGLEHDILRLPRQACARTTELLGREVAPRVRGLLMKEPTHV